MSVAFRFAALFCAAMALAGCGRSASYRYKLTLSLNTPDGVKTGFNVVQVDFWAVSLPAQGEPHRTRGEGIYLDLGPGRRPLIALLTRFRRVSDRPKEIRWGLDEPTDLIHEACLGESAVSSVIDVASKIGACQKPLPITTAELPDLVTFADVNDPRSIMLVDPNDLEATLGVGVSWKSMTLEVVNSWFTSLTTGIEKNLPWVNDRKIHLRFAGLRDFNGLPLEIYPDSFKTDR